MTISRHGTCGATAAAGGVSSISESGYGRDRFARYQHAACRYGDADLCAAGSNGEVGLLSLRPVTAAGTALPRDGIAFFRGKRSDFAGQHAEQLIGGGAGGGVKEQAVLKVFDQKEPVNGFVDGWPERGCQEQDDVSGVLQASAELLTAQRKRAVTKDSVTGIVIKYLLVKPLRYGCCDDAVSRFF